MSQRQLKERKRKEEAKLEPRWRDGVSCRGPLASQDIQMPCCLVFLARGFVSMYVQGMHATASLWYDVHLCFTLLCCFLLVVACCDGVAVAQSEKPVLHIRKHHYAIRSIYTLSTKLLTMRSRGG